MAAFVLVAVLVGVGTFVVTSEVVLYTGLQKAVWLGVDVDVPGASGPPPHIEVEYDGAGSGSRTVAWQNQGGYTQLGIRPVKRTQRLTLVKLATDRGVIDLAKLQLPAGWEFLQQERVVVVSSPDLLRIPGTFQNLDVTFEARPSGGSVRVTWFDQQHDLDLSIPPWGERTARLRLPVSHRGWVLLPAHRIDRIRLTLAPSQAPYVVRSATVLDEPPRVWPFPTLAQGKHQGEGCPSALGSRDGPPRAPQPACTVTVPGLSAVNAVPRYLWLFMAPAVAGAGIVLLAAVAWVGGALRRWDARHEIVQGPLGRWTGRLCRGWTLLRVATVVGLLAAAFHVIYAICVPMGFSYDSGQYYAYAQEFARTHRLDAVALHRTPGYPLFIASTIWLFGDQVQAVVLLQQLALATLGPLTVWFLYARTNALFAGLAGLLAGMSPVVSIMGNIVWTESLFALASCVGILVLAKNPEAKLASLGTGFAVGVATLMRPSGTMLLGVMVGWIFLRWWCGPPGVARQARVVIASIGLLIVGYVIPTAPWYVHFFSRTGRLGLADIAETTLWSGTVFQRRSTGDLIINRPYRSLWQFPSSSPAYFTVLMGDLETQGLAIMKNPGYSMESWREGIRRAPALYLRTARDASLYSFFHVRPDPSPVFYFEELTWHLLAQRARPYPGPAPQAIHGDTRDFLEKLVYRWEPAVSPVRSAMIETSFAGIRGWGMAAALALASAFLVVPLAPLRKIVVLPWLYVVAQAGSAAAIVMPAERYVMFVEPLLYVLASVLLFRLTCVRTLRG